MEPTQRTFSTAGTGGATLGGHHGLTEAKSPAQAGVSARGETDDAQSRWCRQYSIAHRPVRVESFPAGVAAPKKVRIYARGGHYLLHFWDPSVQRTLYERVEGDLIDAIAKARSIDGKLVDLRRSGQGKRRLGHAEMVELFGKDLGRRADAQAIAPATARRYASALAHYLTFTNQSRIASSYPHAARVDRQFALGFAAFLAGLTVSPNGRLGATPRKMRGQDFVLDAVRALFQWAGDPERGNLLPDGFRSPFRRGVLDRRRAARDLAGEPDVTVAMTAAFLAACDDWQLRLFCPLAFYGLRPGELIYLFHEHLSPQFLDVCCIEPLRYLTKGRRNKRLPLLAPVYDLLRRGDPPLPPGLLFLRRSADVPMRRPLYGQSLAELAGAFERRCREGQAGGAGAVERLRDGVLADAGALTYKVIQGEFAKVTRALGWPAAATLKDFRHCCNTALANGQMPEHERRYLLGQNPGRSAIVTYTHLNKIAEHYQAAAERELGPLLEVVARRSTRCNPAPLLVSGEQ